MSSLAGCAAGAWLTETLGAALVVGCFPCVCKACARRGMLFASGVSGNAAISSKAIRSCVVPLSRFWREFKSSPAAVSPAREAAVLTSAAFLSFSLANCSLMSCARWKSSLSTARRFSSSSCAMSSKEIASLTPMERFGSALASNSKTQQTKPLQPSFCAANIKGVWPLTSRTSTLRPSAMKRCTSWAHPSRAAWHKGSKGICENGTPCGRNRGCSQSNATQALFNLVRMRRHCRCSSQSKSSNT
mmetsp:Transcript_68077/g.111926  ORF Transcript_68077/g.111926 Transcript_68077/m.111926 type:complete len:245 (+) Transcript_68077:159-893(+)